MPRHSRRIATNTRRFRELIGGARDDQASRIAFSAQLRADEVIDKSDPCRSFVYSSVYYFLSALPYYLNFYAHAHDHVRAALSLMFGQRGNDKELCHIPAEILDRLPYLPLRSHAPKQKKARKNAGKRLLPHPSTTHKSQKKRKWVRYFLPARCWLKASLAAVMRYKDWDEREVYDTLVTHGSTGVYGNWSTHSIDKKKADKAKQVKKVVERTSALVGSIVPPPPILYAWMRLALGDMVVNEETQTMADLDEATFTDKVNADMLAFFKTLYGEFRKNGLAKKLIAIAKSSVTAKEKANAAIKDIRNNHLATAHISPALLYRFEELDEQLFALYDACCMLEASTDEHLTLTPLLKKREDLRNEVTIMLAEARDAHASSLTDEELSDTRLAELDDYIERFNQQCPIWPEAGVGVGDKAKGTAANANQIEDATAPTINLEAHDGQPYREHSADIGVVFWADQSRADHAAFLVDQVYTQPRRRLFPAIDEESNALPSPLKPPVLRDSQIVTQCETLRRATSGMRGELIADSTGVGKTGAACVAISAVARAANVYADVRDDQDAWADLPLIFRGDTDEYRKIYDADPTAGHAIARAAYRNTDPVFHGFGNSTDSPVPAQQPSIVVTQAGLKDEWYRGLRRFTPELHVVHIEAGSSIERQVEQVENSAPELLARTVILVSHNLLCEHFKKHEAELNQGRRPDRTLFSLNYNLSVCDEAQDIKGLGAFADALHSLNDFVAFTILQTATPIYSSILDLAHICWVGRFPEADSFVRLKDPKMPSALRKDAYQQAKMREEADGKLRRGEVLKSTDQWYLDEQMGPAERTDRCLIATGLVSAEVCEATGLPNPTDQLPEEYTILIRLFLPYIIRRTRLSRDKRGEPIITLGTCTEHPVWTELEPRERVGVARCLARSNDDLRAKRGKSNVGNLAYYGACYREGKTVALDSFFYEKGRLPDPALEPEDYEFTPTRFRTVIEKILEYEVLNEQLAPEDRYKFNIFLDEQSSVAPLKFALAKHGLYARTYSSSLSSDERAKVVTEVCMDGQHESDALDAQGTTMRTNILITLPVGFVGINLHRTNVVFQLSPPWTAAEYAQKIGRHHRTPEDPKRKALNVDVFTLYSPNSVDTVLLSAVMARTRLAGTLDAIDVSAPRTDRAVVISDVRVAFGQHGTAKYDFHRRVNWAQLQLFRSLGMDQYLPFFSRERGSLAITFEFFVKRDDHRDDENGQIRAGVKRSAAALDEDNDQGSASGAGTAPDPADRPLVFLLS